MVRALEEEKEHLRAKLGQFKGMFDGIRQTKSLVIETNGGPSTPNDRLSKSQATSPLPDPNDQQQEQPAPPAADIERAEPSRPPPNDAPAPQPRGPPSDLDMMKEKFAKLLLGEDMSGGGKGVSSALALSNAITNLAASAFGEQKRLEPMAPDTKARWKKEIDWLLSVTDHIVEFVPSKQKAKDGSNMEIMITRQRTDLHMNVPALKKLDGMLLDCLDNFKDQNEFYYEKGPSNNEKWWIPTPKVPPNGLSEVTRKWLQYQKDSVNQVLKAAMAINAQVLTEMEIPESYIEALPKNGRASLGDAMYKSITDDFFDPDVFLQSVDLSSEHKILDLKNKIEASVVIWERKMNAKDNKSAWGSAVSMEKREIIEDRAETILLILKHRFPGIPQSDLDINKIQYNSNVGHAILESYSRIIESLAFTVLSRIDDVMLIDSQARGGDQVTEEDSKTTLLDFMGWEPDTKKDDADADAHADTPPPIKPTTIITNKRFLDKLETLSGLKSPSSRH
ncbi:Rop guanine nucleotide exchange factor 12 [Salvia divinorum]|uniref:Rop guanine nucleotide exchange factor 12 n=1 Tax=Salvia divinorum TaxID=28513 RepID=A0ABD1HSA8_SALDI